MERKERREFRPESHKEEPPAGLRLGEENPELEKELLEPFSIRRKGLWPVESE
jgi:hypothetical protein